MQRQGFPGQGYRPLPGIGAGKHQPNEFECGDVALESLENLYFNVRLLWRSVFRFGSDRQ